ncbi:hypothetical protein GCM10020255_046480 [Rhodococcus baikonurensis]
MVNLQACDGAGKQHVGSGEMCSHDDRSAIGVGKFDDVPPGFGQLRDHGPRMSCEGLAENGRGDSAWAAVEERDTENGLDVVQTSSRNGLRDVKCSSGADHTALTAQRVDEQ